MVAYIQVLIVAAISIAVSNSEAASWGDVAGGLNDSHQGVMNAPSAYMFQRQNIKSNYLLFNEIDGNYKNISKVSRQICIPIINFSPDVQGMAASGNSAASQAAFQQSKELLGDGRLDRAIDLFLAGDVPLTKVMIVWKGIQAEKEQKEYGSTMLSMAGQAAMGALKGGMMSGGGAAPTMGKNMADMQSSNPLATIIPMIQQQNQIISNLYPGSSFDCNAGNGHIKLAMHAFDLRDYTVWQLMTVQEGVNVHINKAGENSYLVELSYGVSGKEPLAVSFTVDGAGDYRISMVRLDSTRADTQRQMELGKNMTTSISTNNMLQRLESHYKKLEKKMNIMQYLVAVLRDPSLRQQVAM